MDHNDNLPQKTESKDLTVKDQIQSKMLNAFNDSIEVVHNSVIGVSFKGKQIKKTQLNAALAVIRMAQNIDFSGADKGVTVNITNIPRPEREKSVLDIGENNE